MDLGEAVAEIGGVRQKVHFFCLDLPQSDACFVKAYPRETTEAFLDGHVAAFAFFAFVAVFTKRAAPASRSRMASSWTRDRRTSGVAPTFINSIHSKSLSTTPGSAALSAALREAAGPVVLVANEVGLGLVPETPLGRRFRDAAGRLNQEIAALADRVVFIAAGLPLVLKERG